MCTWEEIGEKWQQIQTMGYQSVLAAIEVGEELQKKKNATPRGDWGPNISRVIGLKRESSIMTANRLMRLARDRDKIETHKPGSIAQALKLIKTPRGPNKTSPKQIAKLEANVKELEAGAAPGVPEQVKVLVAKTLDLELKKARNEILEDLQQVKDDLAAERKNVGALAIEHLKEKRRYETLLRREISGINTKEIFKILKQATHPDRTEITPTLQKMAMTGIQQLEKFLRV